MKTQRHIGRVESAQARITRIATFLIAAVVLGCASTPAPRPDRLTKAPAISQSKPALPEPQTAPSVEERLRWEVGNWVGTPHKMGGKGHRGIDCSGFVQRIYNDLFNIRLPRTTALQVKVGTSVAANSLRAGDLVFFHPPHKIRHVGIYMGHGEFAHASASKGVTISPLNSTYWRKSFWIARRVSTL